MRTEIGWLHKGASAGPLSSTAGFAKLKSRAGWLAAGLSIAVNAAVTVVVIDECYTNSAAVGHTESLRSGTESR